MGKKCLYKCARKLLYKILWFECSSGIEKNCIRMTQLTMKKVFKKSKYCFNFGAECPGTSPEVEDLPVFSWSHQICDVFLFLFVCYGPEIGFHGSLSISEPRWSCGLAFSHWSAWPGPQELLFSVLSFLHLLRVNALECYFKAGWLLLFSTRLSSLVW